MRMACRDARVSYRSFSAGELSKEARTALMVSIGRISELPIYIDDRATVNATESVRWRNGTRFDWRLLITCNYFGRKATIGLHR
jgi:replicative DNA helicase